MLHPLNDNQLALLNEFKSSGLSLKNFAKFKNIGIHKISYLVVKERKLLEQEDSFSLDSFIPINFNKEVNKYKEKDKLMNIKTNGFNISIKLNDLKELLK